MKLFLDSSVILAACNLSTGASRYICEQAGNQGWELLASPSLDDKDFAELLGGSFYGLAVRKPADFLKEQRRMGRA